jgi:signal transduction histidine kinase
VLPRLLQRAGLRPLGSSASPDDQIRIEHLLAWARLFIALVATVAVYFDPYEPTLFAPVTYSLLVVYTIFSVALAVVLRWAPSRVLARRPALHAIDVVVAAIIALLTQGPSSPFYVFFVFVLMAAALRWDAARTLITGAAFTLAYLVGAVIEVELFPAEVEINRFLMRAAYLAIATLLMAWIAGSLARLQAESALLSRMLLRITHGTRLAATLQDLVGECLAYVGAPAAWIVLHDASQARTFTWRIAMSTTPVRPVPVETPSGEAAFAARPVLADARATHASAVSFQIDEWDGCAWIFDAARDGDDHLHLLQRLAAQLTPAVYGQYLAARMRHRIGDLERARLARDLHDGLIQSLIGIEMEMDALRRQSPVPEVAAELAAIQARLHESVLDTRDLMAHVKPTELGPGGLLGDLAAHAERFRHDTGIDVRLTSSVDEVPCPPRTARELIRIVQEALVNIRKHAGARHVVVRLARVGERWQLSIDDDGKGFEFEGRWPLEALDRERRGPVVIKERVRAIGGALTIDSEPGRGARLVVEWG